MVIAIAFPEYFADVFHKADQAPCQKDSQNGFDHDSG
jgi:hypothetical protein